MRLDHSPGIIINANPQHRASLQESSIKQSPLIYRPAIKNDSGAILSSGLAPTPSKTNAAKVWVVYQKNMRKTILLAGCALLLGTTVIAGDFAADPLDFRNPQQDLFDNLSEMLRETKELQSCEKQQEEALQRFLKAGLSLNAAALMAHNQYPCD